MNYYDQKRKFYTQTDGGNYMEPEAISHGIYKNYYYKQNKGAVIYLEFAGRSDQVSFVKLKQCIRENKITNKKFYSYEPHIDDSQYKYFKDGFFNATEEEKVMFGLIFNNLDAYNTCLDSFNEAEEFYASHAR